MNSIKKIVGVILLLGLISNTFGTDTPPTTCTAKQVLDIFTKWRKGDPLPLPLPTLDQISLQSVKSQYAGYGLKITFTTGDMKLTGLNNFTVKELYATANSLFKAKGVIRFPLLTLTADNYELKGRAYVFYSIKGTGFMNISFQNVTLIFGISLSPKDSGAGVQIDYIRINYSLDGVHVNLEGSSWPVNKVLNAEGYKIIESYHKDLVDMAIQGTNSTLNQYLSSVTPDQLLDTFASECILQY